MLTANRVLHGVSYWLYITLTEFTVQIQTNFCIGLYEIMILIICDHHECTEVRQDVHHSTSTGEHFSV